MTMRRQLDFRAAVWLNLPRISGFTFLAGDFHVDALDRSSISQTEVLGNDQSKDGGSHVFTKYANHQVVRSRLSNNVLII